jgi:hypothetical protein
MIENRAPIASMFSFQLYTIAIMIGRNSVNRDRCMTFDILTLADLVAERIVIDYLGHRHCLLVLFMDLSKR